MIICDFGVLLSISGPKETYSISCDKKLYNDIKNLEYFKEFKKPLGNICKKNVFNLIREYFIKTGQQISYHKEIKGNHVNFALTKQQQPITKIIHDSTIPLTWEIVHQNVQETTILSPIIYEFFNSGSQYYHRINIREENQHIKEQLKADCYPLAQINKNNKLHYGKENLLYFGINPGPKLYFKDIELSSKTLNKNTLKSIKKN